MRRIYKFNRSKRLNNARIWLANIEDKNLVSKYSKRYRVDNLCAAVELNMLGYKVNINDFKKVKTKKDNDRVELPLNLESYLTGFDFVIGCTSGGLPYGINFEEE